MIIEQPAIRWEDALPVGNGHMGAMAYGAIAEERILLNHEALWLPLFKRPTLPDLAPHLPEYRRLLETYQFQEADQFWRRQLKELGWPDLIYTNPFMPAMDLLITQELAGAFTNYRRKLNMSNGETTTRWSSEGVDFERKLFVSRADGVMVLEISASAAGCVELAVSLAPHPMFQDNRKQWHYPKRYAPDEIPLRYTTGSADGRLWLDCIFASKDGAGYCGMAKVAAVNGQAICDGTQIQIRQADSVLILLKIEPHMPSIELRNDMWHKLEELCTDYPTLLSAHTVLHRELYDRVHFELTSTTLKPHPHNEKLLADAYRGESPDALTELLYNYGRYLFISSTARSGLPPNLQGVWNGDYIPAWSSDYTIDENVQMNHWQTLAGNLAELNEPYFRYFESTLEDWKANAKSFYGCRGVLAPLRQSDNGLMSESMPYLIWTAGAGWIAQLFYDHWVFTGDRAFLTDRAIPFLKEVALFYEDFLYADVDARLIVCPSMSPENIPDFPGATRPCVNPTMDIAVCREVLENLIEACEIAGMEPESVVRWKALLDRLPTYQINEDGALREWLYPELKDNYRHRHLSHLYGLFPGRAITPSRNAELFEACEKAVEQRLVVGLQSQTGWSLMHMANLYARLHRGEKALECIDLLARSCVGVNLFTYHNDWRAQGITINDGMYPPFQIDANLGLTAAVQEMLLFSAPGQLDILPALPGRWHAGRITGLKAHGNFTVSISWDPVQITVILEGAPRQVVQVCFPINAIIAPTDNDRASSSGNANGLNVCLPSSGICELRASLHTPSKEIHHAMA